MLLSVSRTARPDLWLAQVGIRAVGLLAGVVAALLDDRSASALGQVGVLLMIALLASIPVMGGTLSTTSVRWGVHVAEAVAAALVVIVSWDQPGPGLPYLLVPPMVTALEFGLVGVLAATGASASVAIGSIVAHPGTTPESAIDGLLWICAGLAAGVAARWARLRWDRRSPRAYYLAANRLLTELRGVARQLPAGLDEISVAQSTLADLRDTLPYERAALYARTESDSLVPLAQSGAGHAGWNPTLDDGAWGQAWTSGRPAAVDGRLSVDPADDPAPSGGPWWGAVLPLNVGDRRTGLVAVERSGGPWSQREVEAAQLLLDDASIRLQTGRLFSEVRAYATVEERRRLAREIHDGIAQEVAALGFLVDDLVDRARDDEIGRDLQSLRSELTRLVTDLRLSIFDLRSQAEHDTGLGAALSAYVRSVATDSGVTVHLVLDESTDRFPPDVESELLRIAQEAVTNARKHSSARNLWVTCRADPPRAFLRVADDGRGLGMPRADSFGLDIMRERAARIGAALTIRPRFGGGTVVEATLDPHSVVSGDQEG